MTQKINLEDSSFLTRIGYLPRIAPLSRLNWVGGSVEYKRVLNSANNKSTRQKIAVTASQEK